MIKHRTPSLSAILPMVLSIFGLTQSWLFGSDLTHIAVSPKSMFCGGLLVAASIYCRSPLVIKRIVFLITLTMACGYLLLKLTTSDDADNLVSWSYFIALFLLVNASIRQLVHQTQYPVPQAMIALLFGGWGIYFWQWLVIIFQVPQVLLPTPTAIGTAIAENYDVLAGDFIQTILKSVVVGYLLGNWFGILSAVLIERSDFLQRGLLPVANLTSTIPLVGIAPIAVMWFGFDWPSKAAVVTLITFFPAMVNTLAGLKSTDRLELELMHSYSANYQITLLKLRLPAAMPFIFNALKLNSPLALVTAVVAEYFGSPTSGLGFRISTEAARMHMPIVWSAIVVASATGSLFYASLVYLERRVTFWHPAIRGK